MELFVREKRKAFRYASLLISAARDVLAVDKIVVVAMSNVLLTTRPRLRMGAGGALTEKSHARKRTDF